MGYDSCHYSQPVSINILPTLWLDNSLQARNPEDHEHHAEQRLKRWKKKWFGHYFFAILLPQVLQWKRILDLPTLSLCKISASQVKPWKKLILQVSWLVARHVWGTPGEPLLTSRSSLRLVRTVKAAANWTSTSSLHYTLTQSSRINQGVRLQGSFR